MPQNAIVRDVVVIGGSVGALDPLKCIVAALPKNLQMTVFVVVHLPADSRSFAPQILNRSGALTARHPEDGERIERGTIYVARPDFHLLIEDGRIRLSRGPRENRHRPAIDPLFRTAARTYGSRVVGVILSGALDDGAFGLMAVKMRGGLTIVQQPDEAFMGQMPLNAMKQSQPDFVLPEAEIGPMLTKIARGEISAPKAGVSAMGERKEKPEQPDVADLRTPVEGPKPGNPSEFACPECHGVLWEETEGGLVRYRCRVGHSYTEPALVGEMSQATEAALWASLRALSEQASILQGMASRSPEPQASRYRDQARGVEEHCETIRKILLKDEQAEAAAS
jgi:two-component system, chemotaxis family, protein-glutamate methylesterase/glutaminase